jgi:FkbM family methyltransferase
VGQRIAQAYSVLKSEGFPSTITKIYRYLGMKVLGVDFYNRPIVNCIRKYSLTKKYSTYIDIGAHTGSILTSVGGLFDHCIAVEPSKRNFAELQKNVDESLGDKCQIFQVALGGSNSLVTLYGSTNNTGDNSIFSRPNLVPSSPVQMITLDTLIDETGADEPFFIKVDVQGAELKVFEGSKRTLQRSCTIISEFWPWGLLNAGSDPEILLRYMRSNGYISRSLEGHDLSEKWLLHFCEVGRTNRFVTTDLLFTKP